MDWSTFDFMNQQSNILEAEHEGKVTYLPGLRAYGLLPRLSSEAGTSSNVDIIVAAVPPENPPFSLNTDVELATLTSGPTRDLSVWTDVYTDKSLGMESKQHAGTIVAPVFQATKSYLSERVRG